MQNNIEQYYPEFLKYANFDPDYDLMEDLDATMLMYKEAGIIDLLARVGRNSVGWAERSPAFQNMLKARREATSGKQIANDLYRNFHPKPPKPAPAPYAVPQGNRIVGVRENPYNAGWRSSKPVVSRKGAPAGKGTAVRPTQTKAPVAKQAPVGKGTSPKPVPPTAPVAKKAPTVAPAESKLNDTLDRAALSLSRMRTMAPGGPTSTAADIARQNVVPSSALNFNPMVNFKPRAPQPAAPQPVSLGFMNFNPAMTDVEGLRRYMTAGPKSSYGATHILDAQINELKALPRTPQRDKLLRHLNKPKFDRMRDVLRSA